MNNIHNPVRQLDETQEQYKIRRKASNEAAKNNSQIGKGEHSTRKMARDKVRADGGMKYFAGAYSKGLRNWITQKNQAALANKE